MVAMSAMQAESAKLLDSWSRHNATSLKILKTSASEFRDVTRALLDGMGETQTAGIDDLLETIETCVDEIARQRSSLVEDAKGVADSLHDFLGSAKNGETDTGEKPKSKLELRVEKLELVRTCILIRLTVASIVDDLYGLLATNCVRHLGSHSHVFSWMHIDAQRAHYHGT